jgi:hypothetical protein
MLKNEKHEQSRKMKLEFSTRRLELRNQRLELVIWRLTKLLERKQNERKL